jgi:hypothetical protein
MPYTVEFNDYYAEGNEAGTYKIREHKSKGLMLPTVKEQAFMDIPMDARTSHANVMDSF